MRTIAIIATLAVAGAALCSNLAPAFANKMNGRCCQWSDGGRSMRYRVATLQTEFPYVLRAHAVSCINQSWNNMDATRICLAGRTRAPSARPPTATEGI
jgi:hypothetical protein